MKVMDILVNGSSEEKHEFGFRILDLNGNGELEYWEFKEAITQIIGLWYSMTGTSSKYIYMNNHLVHIYIYIYCMSVELISSRYLDITFMEILL